MDDSLQQVEFPITHAGVEQVKRFLSDEDDQKFYVLTLKEIEKEGLITKGMNLEDILCAIGSSSKAIKTIRFIGDGTGSRCLSFMSSLLPGHIDLDQRPISIHLLNVDQEQLYMASEPRFAKQVDTIVLNVPWRLKPQFWTLLQLQDFMSRASHLRKLEILHARTIGNDEMEMLNGLSERGVHVDIKNDESSQK